MQTRLLNFQVFYLEDKSLLLDRDKQSFYSTPDDLDYVDNDNIAKETVCDKTAMDRFTNLHLFSQNGRISSELFEWQGRRGLG